MRMQSSQANCGPYALHNALWALGIKRSADECEVLCRTNATEGTYTTALMKAINTIRGTKCKEITGKSLLEAMWYLTEALRGGRPVILCVDDEGHYITAVGLLGDRVLVADSADNELVLSYKLTGLKKRWKPAYWGVIV